MGRLSRTGGEAVQAGTYWNFETGKKVKLERFGLLPGTPSQSYYKAPPVLILAFAAAAAHLFIYVLPKYLTQLYAAYAENLERHTLLPIFYFYSLRWQDYVLPLPATSLKEGGDFLLLHRVNLLR